MLLFLFGFIDFIGAVLLLISLLKISMLATLYSAIAVILILKGLYSLLWKGYYASAVDIGCSALLLLATVSIFVHYAIVVVAAMALLAKSLQSMIPEILG